MRSTLLGSDEIINEYYATLANKTDISNILFQLDPASNHSQPGTECLLPRHYVRLHYNCSQLRVRRSVSSPGTCQPVVSLSARLIVNRQFAGVSTR